MEGKGTAVEFVALIIGRKQWGSKKKKGFNKHSRRNIHALDYDFM